MPGIRDLVLAIRQRDGVDAAVVLGRDGLLIDSDVAANVDAEQVAAHVPSVLHAVEEMSHAAQRGAVRTQVVECERGLAVITVLSADALLLVLVQPTANLGQLLYELRRHRASIAALV
ncbi:MAG: roadblock/LC7 domain-containing protein [Gemmatimonadaceae bacterium]|nr:roadblock/LC7 domain-containing protein [Gemmatimonadaceae bacterium]